MIQSVKTTAITLRLNSAFSV